MHEDNLASYIGIPLVVEPQDSSVRKHGGLVKGRYFVINRSGAFGGSRLAFFDQEDLDEFKTKLKECPCFSGS